MRKYKACSYYKLFLFALLTCLFILPQTLQSIMADEYVFLTEELSLAQSYQNGRSEYVFVDLSDEAENIPMYGEPDERSIISFYALADTSALYGYSTLADELKTIYALFDEAFDAFMKGDYRTKDYTPEENAIALFKVQKSGVTINNILKAYWTYRHDHPEYYWISSYFSYSTEGTLPTVYILMDNSYAQASVRTACETLINNGITPYLTEAAKYNSTYEKIMAVHDMIINEVDYAYNSSGKPEDSIWAHNVIGLFNKKGVVCEGYAKGFQLILNRLGIPNVYVIGYAGEAHAWNYVCIDGKYYAVDVTWNDLGNEYSNRGGIQYQYYCMPGTYFKASHTAYTSTGDPKSGKWLYSLPQLENGNECTYYKKYNALATGIVNSTAAKNFVDNARASARGDYVRILSDDNSKSYIASALGATGYLGVSNYGTYKALFIVENYKIDYPATAMTISATEQNIDMSNITDVIYLELVLNNGATCDDRISWSATNNIVKISGSGTKVKIIPMKNGTTTVTAKASAGQISVSCTITVTGAPDSAHIYLDSGYTQSISEDDITIWVNGGNVKTGDEKINYKQTTVYTDLIASNIVTIKNGKTTTKAGKLIVGVTMSTEEPVLVKNKIVDADAAKIAKASIKNGVITVKAQKQAGMVYLWVYDTGDDKAIAFAPITVKTAASKITILESMGDTTPFKKITLSLNSTGILYLKPTIDKAGTLATDSSYQVAPDAKVAEYIGVSQLGEAEFAFNALGLKNQKATNVKLIATCIQNTKKAILMVTINNPITALSPVANTSLFMKKADIINITLNEITCSENYGTTMKPTVYVMTQPNLTLDSKGKLLGTKAVEVAAKLSADKKSFSLTLKKAPFEVANDAHIYVLYKEGKQYNLFYLGYIDKDTLTLSLNQN